MALRPAYLADKSALARMPNAVVRARLEPLLVDGLVATCGIIDLEIGFSARTAAVHRDVRRERRSLPRARIDDEVLNGRSRSRACWPTAGNTGCRSPI